MQETVLDFGIDFSRFLKALGSFSDLFPTIFQRFLHRFFEHDFGRICDCFFQNFRHRQFCENLILKLGKPLVSTSANLSGVENPKKFSEINMELKDNVDYIVNLRLEEIMDTPSSIVKLYSNGKINKIR